MVLMYFSERVSEPTPVRQDTKTTLSNVSRWKPSHARARGLPRRDSDPRRDDARVSRSSRGKKYVVSGKAVEGQKFELAVC